MTCEADSTPGFLAYAAEGFEGVLECFERFLADDPNYAAQLAVYHKGRKAVDIVGGPYAEPHSVTGVFSCSKGAAALVMALLVQDGLLDLTAPVANYWPEFAAAAKDSITVHQLLSHQAGLPGVDGGVDIDEFIDSEKVAARLAALTPVWRPGDAFGYHALTIGVFMEELCRRIVGKPLQVVHEERLRSPLKAEFFLGLPEHEDSRFREVLWEGAGSLPWFDPHSLHGMKVNAGRVAILDLANLRSVRAAGIAGAGGVASAEGMARLYAGAITGLDEQPPLLTSEVADAVSAEQVFGLDRISGELSAFATGFMKPTVRKPFGSHRAFGHGGANGALGFADPAYDLAFGYVPRRAENRNRGISLTEEVRKAILASASPAC